MILVGGRGMEDKISDLLAQYDLMVYRAGRVKGAWVLETDRGLKSLGNCSYSEGLTCIFFISFYTDSSGTCFSSGQVGYCITSSGDFSIFSQFC